MPSNLKLDFSLETTTEREAFISNYLRSPRFETTPPTNADLELMADYILWGKDSTGLSAVQQGEIEIETKNGTWGAQPKTESLDALLESVTFNENTIQTPTLARPKKVREVFNREQALNDCPDFLRQTLEDLFIRIDTLELGINFYDLAHNKRTKPPRAQLLNRFTPDQQDEIQAAAEKWPQYTYLKKRHELVEMRREQYTLRDSFSSTLQTSQTPMNEQSPRVSHFAAEIPVYPLGLWDSTSRTSLIFRPFSQLIPANYTEAELRLVSDLIWEIGTHSEKDKIWFDFANLEHVYELFRQWCEINDAAADSDIESTLRPLIKTAQYYAEMANLPPAYKEILDLKIQKHGNQEIASAINKKFGKTYTANYISTIFRQKAIVKINETAQLHRRIVENLFFEEEFKTCTKCGRTLLRDPVYFMHKSRSNDGYATRCKECEKEDRNRRNQK